MKDRGKEEKRETLEEGKVKERERETGMKGVINIYVGGREGKIKGNQEDI